MRRVRLGDGGLISTASGVARFIEALFRKRTVLSEAKLQEMVDFDARSSYGLGVERGRLGASYEQF